MNAMSLEASELMRVLSPRMLPPESWLLGSIGEHGDLLSVFANQIGAQHFNHAALARAGNAGDADANGVAAMGKAVFDNLLGQLPVSLARALDQRDGLGQNGAVAAQNAIDILLGRADALGPCGTRARLARRLRSSATGPNMQRALIRDPPIRNFLQRGSRSGFR